MDPPSAFQRVVEEYYKPGEIDQIPFKFPEEPPENHPIIPNLFPIIQQSIEETTVQDTILQQTEEQPLINATISTIFENTAKNVTEEATSVANDIVTSGRQNVTSIINEIFNNSATSTESTATLDVGTDLSGNSTGSTDLGTFMNETIGNVHKPEHAHHETNTAIIILSIVLCVLVVSILAGLVIYFYKKRALKQAGNFKIGATNRRASEHVVAFTEDTAPSTSVSNHGYLKSSQL